MGTASDPQLVVDVGNSGGKAAVYRDGQRVSPVHRFTDDEWAEADRLVTNHGVKNIIYSTVANVLPERWTDKWLADGLTVVALSPALPLPFRSEYKTMATLGQDRIAAVAGCLALPAETTGLPPGARLIVDAGSCATLDLVDAAGTYRGGNISPGARMRLRAMHAFTARLPQTEPAEPVGPVGQSTTEALRHGAQLGLVYEIEGLYRRLRSDHPGLGVILTGGDAPWLAGRLSIPFFHSPHLVLLGLHQILSNYVRNEA